MGLIVLAITREQQQRASESLLGGIEELIDQVRFNPDVSRKHVRNEEVGERVFLVENASHFLFLDHKEGSRYDRGGRPHPDRLTCEAALAKKVAGTQNCDDGFLPRGADYGEPDTAVLYVQDVRRGIALREDSLLLSKLSDRSCQACRIEKFLSIEWFLERSFWTHSGTSCHRQGSLPIVLWDGPGLQQAFICLPPPERTIIYTERR